MSAIKKLGLLIFLVVAAAAAFALYQFWGERYQIVLTEDQLISKLNQKFPFDKTYLFLIQLHFSNPILALEEGSNRIAFGCDIETKIKVEVNSESGITPLRGTAKLSGKVRYDSSNGAFFLDEPIVETLDIKGIPETWRTKVNDAASKAASEFLTRSPLYRLQPTDIKKAAARLILRNVEIADKKLILTMGVG